MRHSKIKITPSISLVILAGLWLMACNYNPVFLVARAVVQTEEIKESPHNVVSFATSLPTLTPTPLDTATPTPPATPTATLEVPPTNTLTPTSTPLPTATPTQTPAATNTPPPTSTQTPTPVPPRTVFLIVMENTNWAEIKGSNSAPYLNNVLLLKPLMPRSITVHPVSIPASRITSG